MKKLCTLLIAAGLFSFGCCKTNEDGTQTSALMKLFESEDKTISYLNIPSGGYKFPEPPEEFKDKRMPEGGWTNQDMIDEGKRIYDGVEVDGLACKTCHGSDGKPIMTNARDFRDPTWVKGASDAFWFWRIMEGVEETPMAGWGEMFELTDKQIWSVMAYEHTFHNDRKPAERDPEANK